MLKLLPFILLSAVLTNCHRFRNTPEAETRPAADPFDPPLSPDQPSHYTEVKEKETVPVPVIPKKEETKSDEPDLSVNFCVYMHRKEIKTDGTEKVSDFSDDCIDDQNGAMKRHSYDVLVTTESNVNPGEIDWDGPGTLYFTKTSEERDVAKISDVIPYKRVKLLHATYQGHSTSSDPYRPLRFIDDMMKKFSSADEFHFTHNGCSSFEEKRRKFIQNEMRKKSIAKKDATFCGNQLTSSDGYENSTSKNVAGDQTLLCAYASYGEVKVDTKSGYDHQKYLDEKCVRDLDDVNYYLGKFFVTSDNKCLVCAYGQDLGIDEPKDAKYVYASRFGFSCDGNEEKFTAMKKLLN